jgi:D-inositol-3-phosphate glycosyltransferase
MISLLEQQSTSFDEVASKGRWPRICEKHESLPWLRVALLCFHTSPLEVPGKSRDAGGMNVYICDLVSHLDSLGIAVDVFTRWTNPQLPQIIPLGAQSRLIHIPAGPCVPISKNELYSLTSRFADGIECFAITNQIDYHLIHSHYWLSAVSGARLARRWGAPHLTMFHTLARLKQHAYPDQQELLLRSEQECHLIHTVDTITVATENEREQIVRYYGSPRTSIYTIPCGVDLNHFIPGNRLSARYKLAEYIPNDSSSLLLYVGRLDPLKGAELLIQSASMMHNQARIALIGGNDSDPERSRLRDLASVLGIDERVYFFDAVSRDEIVTWYHAANLLVVPSYYESFGLTAVEALACGIPVIATHTGGLSAIIKTGVNGTLINRRTPLSFAWYIDALLDDPAELACLAANSRLSVIPYDWNNIANKMSSLYTSLLDSSVAMQA